MVSFSGYAEGEYFKGNILPGTVDTQTVLPDGSTHLSARYMLKGIDQNEDSCRILYKTMEVTSDTPKGYTRPTIVTDSRLLSSLITGKLVGKIDTTGGSFKIRIFCIRKIAVHVRYRTIKGVVHLPDSPFPIKQSLPLTCRTLSCFIFEARRNRVS